MGQSFSTYSTPLARSSQQVSTHRVLAISRTRVCSAPTPLLSSVQGVGPTISSPSLPGCEPRNWAKSPRRVECRRYTAAMRQALKRHPDSPCGAAIEIEVEAARPGPGALRLRYRVTGEIGALRLPPVDRAGARRRALAAQLLRGLPAAGPGGAYYEFNFAPSTHWAAYRFSGYRERDERRERDRARRGSRSRPATALRAAGRAGAGPPARAAGDAPWQLGLSAVIEETGGGISYWALAHPPGQAGLSSFRLLCPGTSRSCAAMNFGIDRLLAEPALRAPLQGRRVALLAHPASVTAGPDPFARRAGRLRRPQAQPPPSARSTACAATSRTT